MNYKPYVISKILLKNILGAGVILKNYIATACCNFVRDTFLFLSTLLFRFGLGRALYMPDELNLYTD